MNGSHPGRLAAVLVAMAWLAQAGIAAAAVPSHVDRFPARTTPDDTSVNFPTTAVGQMSSICEGVCFTLNTSPPAPVTARGTETLDHDVSSPFSANDYVKGNVSSSCTGTPVTLPTNLSSGQVLWFDLNFTPSRDGDFSDTLTSVASTSSSTARREPRAGRAFPMPPPCASTTTLATSASRSRSLSDQPGRRPIRSGSAIPLSSLGVTQGGLFWFFGATNPEMLIKIIDGCTLTSKFWVFYAATTNVAFIVTVTDTMALDQAVYTNQDLQAAVPVQDTSALTCP